MQSNIKFFNKIIKEINLPINFKIIDNKLLYGIHYIPFNSNYKINDFIKDLMNELDKNEVEYTINKKKEDDIITIKIE